MLHDFNSYQKYFNKKNVAHLTIGMKFDVSFTKNNNFY